MTKIMPSERFRINMRRLRRLFGLSQEAMVEQVERKFGIRLNRATLAKVETGTHGIPLDLAVAVAGVLGVTVEDLVREMSTEVLVNGKRPGSPT